jgi:hypothetical protein
MRRGEKRKKMETILSDELWLDRYAWRWFYN